MPRALWSRQSGVAGFAARAGGQPQNRKPQTPIAKVEIRHLLPNNQRQRLTCYALCHILYPVSAALFRMDSNSTSEEQMVKHTARDLLYRARETCCTVCDRVVSEPYRAVRFSIQEQPLSRNVERFQGGLVFKAHRLMYHSTLGSRVER